MKRLLILFLFWGLIFNNLSGQKGLNVSMLKGNIFSQKYQPANIMSPDHGAFSVGVNASFLGEISSFPLSTILTENGYLDLETRQKMVDMSADGMKAGLGYNIGWGISNFQHKDRNWSVYWNSRNMISASLSSGDALGLVFLGNKHYLGDTINAESIGFGVMGMDEIGFGTGFGNDKFSFGFRVKFLAGSNFSQLKLDNLKVYTAPDGTQIDLSGNVDLYSIPSGKHVFNPGGIGGGVDLGFEYHEREKYHIGLSLLDIGGLAWFKGTHAVSDPDVSFSGIEAGSLLSGNLLGEGQEAIDSILTQILPDSSVGNRFALLPSYGILNGDYYFGKQDQIGARVLFSLNEFPTFNLGYVHHFGDVFGLGINAFGGGNTSYGFGLMGNAKIPLGTKYKLDIFVNADDISGIIPNFGKGFSVSGGIIFRANPKMIAEPVKFSLN